jgi:hypothetical protein
MPRRREVPKREILPDPKYGNIELAKFMNVIMQGGKKAVAERIIYGALDFIEKNFSTRVLQETPDKFSAGLLPGVGRSGVPIGIDRWDSNQGLGKFMDTVWHG